MKLKAKKEIQNRLNRIEGQIRGLQRLIEQDTYCVDIITQTSAVKRALSGVEDALLEGHLASCVIDQVKSGKHEKAVSEILKVYSLKRR